MSVTPLLLLHAGVTLFMTGLIWFVQVVHYPMFDRVGRESFAAYEIEHARRTTWVVGPVMLMEAVTAALLVVLQPERIPVWWVWAGAGLLAVVWMSTAFLQVPQHRVLSTGFNRDAHRTLVKTNWIRTIAWSLRAALALAMIGRAGPG